MIRLSTYRDDRQAGLFVLHPGFCVASQAESGLIRWDAEGGALVIDVSKIPPGTKVITIGVRESS
jgi:hypothetical protein